MQQYPCLNQSSAFSLVKMCLKPSSMHNAGAGYISAGAEQYTKKNFMWLFLADIKTVMWATSVGAAIFVSSFLDCLC